MDEVGVGALRLSGKRRGTSLIRNSNPLGPYSRTLSRVLDATVLQQFACVFRLWHSEGFEAQ